MKTYTWLLIFLSIVSQSVSISQETFLWDVHMFDSSNVIIVGNSFLGRSTDGGYTWAIQYAANMELNKFCFINDSVGFAGVNGLSKTTDRGITWKPLNSAPHAIMRWDFVDENIGYVGAGHHYAYRTIDGSANWTFVFYAGNNSIKCVSFITEERGMISTFGIHKTTDGGKTWVPTGNPYWVPFNIWFFDENTVVGVGGGIERTTDFGANWEQIEFQFPFENRYLSDVFFVDSDIGFAVGGKPWDKTAQDSMGAIISTKDGGLTWELQTDQLGQHLFGVHFYNQKIGMAVGMWDAVYKTIDGGENWKLISIPTNVVSEDDKPKYYQLSQNYPNPFNPTTTISYSVSKPGFVTLNVYDILGNEITTLVSEEKIAGSYEVKFDGSNLASGIYIYRLTSGKFNASKKLILLK